MKLLTAIVAGVAFYLGCYWLAERYGVLWFVGAMIAAVLILGVAACIA